MSDDFATANGNGLEIVELPEQLDATEDTAVMLGLGGSSTAAADWPKSRLDVEQAAPNGRQLRSRPRRLLFPDDPRLETASSSRCRRLKPCTLLGELTDRF